MKATSLMVLYAAVLHSVWAIILLLVGHPIAFTNATNLDKLVGNVPLEALILVSGSTLAVLGRIRRRHPRPRAEALALIPQQALLALSAASAIAAILARHYGDGVARPWTFIFLDQLPSIIAYGLHTFVVVLALQAAFLQKQSAHWSYCVRRAFSVKEN